MATVENTDSIDMPRVFTDVEQWAQGLIGYLTQARSFDWLITDASVTPLDARIVLKNSMGTEIVFKMHNG